MSLVPWLRLAAPYRDSEVERLKQAGFAELRLQVGSSPLQVSEDLQGIGCSAMLMIVEDRRKVLTVKVTVVSPDNLAMSTDGFKITPKGKITPLHTDYYDD